jgi:protein tyrosine phosphatase
VQKNELAKSFEQLKPLKDLLSDSKSIYTQFDGIGKLTDLKPSVDQFKGQDIYCDIHPYEETMIWLDNKPRTEQGYINCSRIKSTFKEAEAHMIATQGP